MEYEWLHYQDEIDGDFPNEGDLSLQTGDTICQPVSLSSV